MQKNIRLRLFSNLVIAYMLLALAWWSFLLFTKNRDAFIAKAGLGKMIMIANQEIKTDAEFLQTALYKDLADKYDRQEWMIMGESIVFAIILVIGIWFINRGYNQQVIAAQQSRNFLLSITHELKSPLASIQLILETFKKRQLKEEQIKKLSQNALKETNRLNTLVNDLLLAAKVETAYQPYIEHFSLSKLLQDSIEMMQQQHPQAYLELKQEQEVIEIQGDRMGIASIVINLLENAVKYGPAVPRVVTTLHQKNDTIWMEFADNGIGIPDKEKNKVFERFYRVGNEDTRQTKGAGLGLYIVAQIVKAHQGIIKVSDNVPNGAIFTVSLPNVCKEVSF